MHQSAKREARWFITLVPVILVLLVIVLLGVAKNATPPDPNDPRQNPEIAVELAEKNINALFWALDARVRRKQITEARSKEILAEYASAVADSVSQAGIRPSDAFRFGEILRTARRWKDAQSYFEIALARNPDLPDRVVNCRIRIAHCLAEQKLVKEAIFMARLSFEAPPGNKPSILLGIYMQVAPAASGQGQDEELARLIDEAVDQHLQSVVDPTALSGQAFINARRHHIAGAYRLAKSLASSSPELVKRLSDQETAALARL